MMSAGSAATTSSARRRRSSWTPTDVSGGGASDSSYPLAALALAAGVVAAIDFVLVSRGAALPLAAMGAGIAWLAWRAWLAARSFGPVLTDRERSAALARFRRVPVAASIACLV